MKTTKALFLFLAAFALTACSSDPEWADPEAHEKTIQLNEKYGPLMIGTWHYENSSDKHRFFELLTFKDDGTFTGKRTWQSRKLVTIDGKEQYTDWQDVEPLAGTFTGKWSLRFWRRNRQKVIWLTPTSPTSTMPVKPHYASVDITSTMKTGGRITNGAMPNRILNSVIYILQLS